MRSKLHAIASFFHVVIMTNNLIVFMRLQDVTFLLPAWVDTGGTGSHTQESGVLQEDGSLTLSTGEGTPWWP
jgi:hypothetical protein